MNYVAITRSLLHNHPLLGKTVLAVIAIFFFFVPIPAISSSPHTSAQANNSGDVSPSVECLSKLGLSGKITAPLMTGRLTEDGEELVFVGTSDGLYIISRGVLDRYIYTPFGVSHIMLINDISGDGSRDIVLSLDQADVPVIRCYDGVTGEELWQFATRQRVYVDNLGWCDIQLGTNDMAISGGHDSEIIIISTGRYVFGVDTRTGIELWSFQSLYDLGQLAVVADLDGDGIDDVAVASKGGNLYLLSGRTGKVEWDTKIAGQYVPQNGPAVQTAVSFVDVYDREVGKVVVGSGDGKVQLVDLRRRTVEWKANLVFDINTLPVKIYLAVTPDATGDGRPDVLATIDAGQSGMSPQSGSMIQAFPVFMLDGSSGDVVWQNELYFWPDTKFPIAFYDGQMVLIEPLPSSKVDLVDLSSGRIVNQIIVPTLDGKALRVRQASDNNFIAVSDGNDLTLVTANGTMQWCYPRVESVSVVEGSFTSEGSHDILAYGNSSLDSIDKETTRVISMINDTTYEEIWHYEIPYTDFYTIGGLSSVQKSPDLTGDGLQDIVGYRGQTVFRFNGATGSLTMLDTNKDICYMETMLVDSGRGAIVCSTEDEVFVIDGSGSILWTTGYSSWSNISPGEVRVIGDINSDGISDLAIIFPDRIIIMGSKGSGGLNFDVLRIILPGDDVLIAFREVTADIDGDGVGEIAYYEFNKETYLSTGKIEYTALVIVLPTGEGTSLRLPMDRQASFNLACGDFDGDGFLDTLLFWEEKTIASPYSVKGARLEVFSGSDGHSLWHLDYAASSSRNTSPGITSILADNGSNPTDIPAAAIRFPGINRDYLAISTVISEDRMRLSVYDLGTNTLVMQVSIPPLQQESDSEYQDTAPIPGASLKSMAGIVQDARLLSISTSQRLGTLSMDTLGFLDVSGDSLVGFFPFVASDFFATGEPCTVGIAAAGGLYSLHLAIEGGESDGTLNVISPVEESTVRSPVRIAWEGNAGFADIFVDGIKVAMAGHDDVRLSLPSGEREVVIRHIDEDGRITYAVVHFKVRQLPLAVIASFVILAVLVVAYIYPGWVWSRRKRRAQEGMDSE